MRSVWAALTIGCAAGAACGGRSNLDPSDFAFGGNPAVAAPQSGSSPDNPGSDPHTGSDADADAGADADADADADAGAAPAPPNPNCTPNNAKGGQACTAPCVTTCGFYDLGTRACDCVNGVFVSCSCPRPWDYLGRTTAPACNTPDGRTHWLDNTPCFEPWAQCIGTDPISGTNPRGCVCLTDPVSGALEWTCGSTNRWFLSE